jgi:hypothetical protein
LPDSVAIVSLPRPPESEIVAGARVDLVVIGTADHGIVAVIRPDVEVDPGKGRH